MARHAGHVNMGYEAESSTTQLDMSEQLFLAEKGVEGEESGSGGGAAQ